MDRLEFKLDVDEQLMAQRIIIGALAGGVVMFLIVANVMLHVMDFDAPLGTGNLITLIMLAFAALTILARFVVVGSLTKNGRKRIAAGTYQRPYPPLPADAGDADQLLSVYSTRLLISAALCEGPAFALTIAYLLEGNVYAMVAAILLVFGILAHFPTRSGLEDWISQQLLRLDEERQWVEP